MSKQTGGMKLNRREIASLNPYDATAIRSQRSKIGYAFWVGRMAFSLVLSLSLVNHSDTNQPTVGVCELVYAEEGR